MKHFSLHKTYVIGAKDLMISGEFHRTLGVRLKTMERQR